MKNSLFLISNKFIEAERNKTSIEIEKISKASKISEKTASRLAEDVFEAIDLNNKKFTDFEDRLDQLKDWVEKLSKCSGILNHFKTIDLPKINSDDATNPSVVLKSELMEFERKLNQKILESLDETNEIMKKIKKQYKGLSSKVKDLEVCFYESSKTAERSKSKKKQPSNRSHSIINNDISNRSLSLKDSSIKKEQRQKIASSDRAVKDQTNDFDVTNKNKYNSIVPSNEPITTDTIERHAKDIENTNKETKKLAEFASNERSKEFTDFMTFEDQNSSDIFELSDNDRTLNKSKSKSKNKSNESKR